MNSTIKWWTNTKRDTRHSIIKKDIVRLMKCERISLKRSQNSRKGLNIKHSRIGITKVWFNTNAGSVDKIGKISKNPY